MVKNYMLKSILILVLLCSLFTLLAGCGSTETPPEQPTYDVKYINNNLKADNFQSYFYQKTITNDDVLLLEENTTVTKQADKYVVKTEITKLNPLDESSKYKTEEKEEVVTIASDPITLELKEDDFETVNVTSTSLTGKVKNGSNILGYEVQNLNITIKLTSNGVSEIELSYLDGDFAVKIIVKYNY